MTKHLILALLFGVSGCFGNTVVVLFDTLPEVNQHGTYNGFVGGSVDGVRVELICDDEFHTTYVPSSTIYDYSDFKGTSDSIPNARFLAGGANLSLYREASLLLYEMVGAPKDAATVTNYQYALWDLFNPGVAFNEEQQTLQSHAAAAVANPALDLQPVYSSMRVYTPTANYAGNQEFLQYTTPEPSSFAPLGGLALLAVWARRRFQCFRE